MENIEVYYPEKTNQKDWTNKIAKAISYLFHPLLMPFYGVLMIFNIGSYIVFSVSPAVKYFVYAIVFINTFLIPAMAGVFLLKKGMIQSLEMNTTKERRFPLLITGLFYSITYYFLQKFPLPPLIYLILLGATLSVLISMMVNLFWKISAHMIGAGGMVGTAIGISLRLSLDLNLLIISLIVLSGLIGSSRLALNAHNQSQIYIGFFLGLGCMLLVMLGI